MFRIKFPTENLIDTFPISSRSGSRGLQSYSPLGKHKWLWRGSRKTENLLFKTNISTSGEFFLIRTLNTYLRSNVWIMDSECSRISIDFYFFWKWLVTFFWEWESNSFHRLISSQYSTIRDYRWRRLIFSICFDRTFDINTKNSTSPSPPVIFLPYKKSTKPPPWVLLPTIELKLGHIFFFFADMTT